MNVDSHGRHLGDRDFSGRVKDEASYYGRFAPFESSHPCRCGSKARVWNLTGKVFCGRCGKPQGIPVRPTVLGASW